MQTPHVLQFGNLSISARHNDNYVNATHLCQLGGKLFKNWNNSQNAGNMAIKESFVEHMFENLLEDENRQFLSNLLPLLREETNGEPSIKIGDKLYNSLHTKCMIIETSIIIGRSADNATWVHPLLAVSIAQWVSPAFSMQVDVWVHRLLRDRMVECKNETKGRLLEEIRDTRGKIASRRD